MVWDIIMTAAVMRGRRGRGVQWYLVNKFGDLDYAGDICLTAPTLQAVKGKFQD
jgi:hypothetical protein